MIHLCPDEIAAIQAFVSSLPGIPWFCFHCMRIYRSIFGRKHDCDF